MKSFKTKGIILKRKNLGEADRIITLFTKKHGKIKVIAKGVRRITSKKGGNVELFNEVEMFIHQGRTLDILTEAQLLNSFSNFRKNLDLVGLAFHVCELVDNLCPENQPHPNVYDHLIHVLNELDHGVVAQFEKNLLVELGYLPKSLEKVNTASFVEKILERKLKTRRILHLLQN